MNEENERLGPPTAPVYQVRHRTRMTREIGFASKLWIFLMLLVFIVGAGNLWATFDQNQSTKNQFAAQQKEQQALGKAELAKLCSTFGNLAALKPPAGSATDNPSRAYEQQQHDILAGVVTDLKCP